MPLRRFFLVAFAALVVVVIGAATCATPAAIGVSRSTAPAASLPVLTPIGRKVSFESDVKPVLENLLVCD